MKLRNDPQDGRDPTKQKKINMGHIQSITSLRLIGFAGMKEKLLLEKEFSIDIILLSPMSKNQPVDTAGRPSLVEIRMVQLITTTIKIVRAAKP